MEVTTQAYDWFSNDLLFKRFLQFLVKLNGSGHYSVIRIDQHKDIIDTEAWVLCTWFESVTTQGINISN